MRTCLSCGIAKPEEAFRLRKSISTGLHYRGKKCRACHQIVSLAWRRANPELVLKYGRRCREKPGARTRYNRQALKSHFVRKFGITVEERDAMLAAQGGTCVICGTDKPKGRGWCVDHDHHTGRLRSVICQPCNLVLGHAHESLLVLERATIYLEAHSASEHIEEYV